MQAIQDIENNQTELDPNIIQAKASNPLSSVWVGASAGTGKTKILTDRVLRLLLPHGNDEIGYTATDPSKILCITFTKAGAAEMANRVNKVLGEWAVMDADKLIGNLTSLLGHYPDDETIIHARKLFAKVVDVPGGMKILTIHSFCQSILGRFPLEADVSPNFEVMDDRTTYEYLNKCQRDVINQAYQDRDADIGQAMENLTSLLDLDSMTDIMGILSNNRGQFLNLIREYQGVDNLIDAIYQRLEVDKSDSEVNILSKFKSDLELRRVKLHQACLVLLDSTSKTDIAKGQKIASYLDGSSDFNEYKTAFLTGKDEPYSKPATKKPIEIFPDIVQIMQMEADRIILVLERVKTVNLAKNTESLLHIGGMVIEKYQRMKVENALLDYDDLIYKVKDLLASPDRAAWVLFKLDGGIDHILIDEAQDTNPDQWKVIKNLTSEFFAGTGSRDENIIRTIFTVGDEKQSIFSFQKADPKEFENMRNYFAEKVINADKSWTPVDMNISFRSTEAILTLVDAVFKDERVKSGVVFAQNPNIEHISFNKGRAGLVEIWPVIPKPVKQEVNSWEMPEKTNIIKSPQLILSEKVADTIREWLDDKEILESTGNPIQPKDIMILVRSRGKIVEKLVTALKLRKIPVSGVDRMVLTEQLVVQDLLSFINFALLPEDDLNLATILKNPVIGLNEDELFEIAYDRPSSLYEALRIKRPDIHQYLRNILRKSGYMTPYDFLANILNAPCPNDEISGRRGFLSRLGFDSMDAMEELLNASLEYSMAHIPSLQKFIAWFKTGQSEIKRDQEQSGANMVRIMTVHGSKGLQAPIVFLPDTVSRPKDNAAKSPKLLWDNKADKQLPLWAPASLMRDSNFEELLNISNIKDEEEYKRLLYVALTRAEDRLYISGFESKSKPQEDSWYKMIEPHVKELGLEIEFKLKDFPVAEGEEGLKAYRFKQIQTAELKKTDQEGVRITADSVPDWFRNNPNMEPSPPKPLMPSKPSELEPSINSPLGSDEGWRFKRGNLTHKLLEFLPELPIDRRYDSAIRYLQNADIPEHLQEQIAVEVIKVLNHPEFSIVFGINSIAEIPITGMINGKVISGKIDRLYVDQDMVMIIDYKSNRPSPKSEDLVPEIYINQMQSYKEIIKKLYPNRQIKTALLWTDEPRLMELNL